MIVEHFWKKFIFFYLLFKVNRKLLFWQRDVIDGCDLDATFRTVTCTTIPDRLPSVALPLVSFVIKVTDGDCSRLPTFAFFAKASYPSLAIVKVLDCACCPDFVPPLHLQIYCNSPRRCKDDNDGAKKKMNNEIAASTMMSTIGGWIISYLSKRLILLLVGIVLFFVVTQLLFAIGSANIRTTCGSFLSITTVLVFHLFPFRYVFFSVRTYVRTNSWFFIIHIYNFQILVPVASIVTTVGA